MDAAAAAGKPRVAAGSHTTAMFTPRSHARSEARNISSSRVESPEHQIELTVEMT
jgi:hypothetical protein